MDYMNAKDLIIALAEDKELSKNEILRHFSYFTKKSCKDCSTKSLMALCACALLQSDMSKVDQFIDTISQKEPSALLWFIIGLKYMKSQKFQFAIDAFKICSGQELKLKKKNYLVHLKTIECYIASRNYSNAIKTFSDNSSEFPAEVTSKLLCSIGYCYEQKGNKENAVMSYKNASRLTSSFSLVSEIWADFLDLNLEDLVEKIEKILEKYLEHSQEWCDCKFLLAQVYLEQKKLPEAIKILQLLNKSVNHQEYYLSCLGSAWMKVENYSEAFICYLRAANINPSIAEVWFNMALIYSTVGQEESEPAFRRAKSLDIEDLLPSEIHERSQLLPVRFSLAQFGQCTNSRSIALISAKASTRNIIRNTLEKPAKVQKGHEIVVPLPVKFAQPINELKKYDPLMQIENQSLFLYQSCFSFFNKYKEQLSKIDNGNEEGQAAQILADFGNLPSNLPCKRTRDN